MCNANFQGDNFAAYCCKVMGGGHIGGKGYGGFEFNFWAYRSTSNYSATLINQAYIGHASTGILQVVSTSTGIEVQVINQSTTARQDMRAMLSVAGCGSSLLMPLF